MIYELSRSSDAQLICCKSYINIVYLIWKCCFDVCNNECDQNLCQVTYCHCVLLCRDSVAMLFVATADTHKASHSLILFVIYCLKQMWLNLLHSSFSIVYDILEDLFMETCTEFGAWLRCLKKHLFL